MVQRESPTVQTLYNSNPNLREGISDQGVVVYLSVVVGLYEVYCTVVSKSAPLYVYNYLERKKTLSVLK